jgi:dihydroorotate dehydrogenase electron transfer subunit
VIPIAEIGRLIAGREISLDQWDMIVEAPKIAKQTQAGQFVHVRVGDGFNPFLRRPLSIGPVDGDQIRLIFTVRGEGTRLLTRKHVGDPVDLIGPLGRPFILPAADELPVFVTGGIGIVPLLALDSKLPKAQNRLFLFGVRSRNAMPVTNEELAARRIQISSDDGSIGHHGNVISLLEKVLPEDSNAKKAFYACGPEPMLIGLKRFCVENNYRCYISMEVPMGCGLGACQSCAVPRADGNGYLLVCKDGPVFDCRDVLLKPEEKR